MNLKLKKEKKDKLKEEFEVLIHWTPEGKKGGMMSGYIPEKGNLLLPDAVWSFIESALTQAKREERERMVEEIKRIGLSKDPTISNKEWRKSQIYEAGFKRAKELILYFLNSKSGRRR